jgi:hypothetical protein
MPPSAIFSLGPGWGQLPRLAPVIKGLRCARVFLTLHRVRRDECNAVRYEAKAIGSCARP